VFARPLRRTYRVTARYGQRGNWLAGHHTGIDLAVPRGTPVYAICAGTVVLAQWSGAYGNAVTIRMRDGRYVLYAHLNRIRTHIGSRIATGARIADSGSTGRATGPHLHLEVRSKRFYGSDVDPVAYLARHGVRLL
jgi:murein DD-endopeptidase MepM/ murein hydrolase activator NlpD